MRVPVIATLLVVAIAACAREPASGAVPLVNGSPATEPSIVAVIHTRTSGTRQLCTGTIVAPRAVLTAKHCVFEDLGGAAWAAIPVERLSILFGDDILGAPGDEITVTAVDTTDGPYRDGDGAIGGDVAILTLARDAGVSALEVSTAAPASGTSLRIVGFGYTEPGGTGTLGTRHDGTASIVSVADGTFTSEGPQWTCTGDSGGPALEAASGRVIGVTSIGPRGCTTSSSIYTRLDRHADLLARAGVVVSAPADAASLAPDASAPPGLDAGTTPAPPSSPGCGCSVPRPARGTALAILLAVLAVGAARFCSGTRGRRAPPGVGPRGAGPIPANVRS